MIHILQLQLIILIMVIGFCLGVAVELRHHRKQRGYDSEYQPIPFCFIPGLKLAILGGILALIFIGFGRLILLLWQGLESLI